MQHSRHNTMNCRRTQTQHNVTDRNTTQRITTQHKAMQHNRHNTTDRNTMQRNAMQHNITQQNSPQHNKTGNKNCAYVQNKPVKVMSSSTKNSTEKNGQKTLQVNLITRLTKLVTPVTYTDCYLRYLKRLQKHC